MSCLELSLDTTHEAVDWVRTLLAETQYTSEVNVTEYVHSSEDCGLESLEWAFTLHFYLPYDRHAHSRVEAIERLLSPLHRTGLTTELDIAVIEEQPLESEGEDSLLHRVGERFVVLSPERSYAAEVGKIPIRLGKTFAFGSGLHPATMLSLRLLERYVKPSMQVLDLGSGTGILSVAIAQLGAQVLAVDNDPIAVAATEAAVQQNQVCDRVTVMQGSLGSGSTLGHWMSGETIEGVTPIESTNRFDLIMANILGRVHLSLIEEYQRSLRQTAENPGLLITSGFTTEYESEIATAFDEVGFELIEVMRSGLSVEASQQWVAMVHQLKSFK